jgi:predicted MFS family arabinose efflux permease
MLPTIVESKKFTKFTPWLMWGLTLGFFAFQFILRLFPGLLMPQLMQKFSIDATAFGFLSAMYYFGYAGMQIPVAIMLDRYGPRVVVSCCVFICAVATVLFAATESWYLAMLGRFLIGASSAAGFLGTSKVVSLYFPHNLYARMIGYTFSIGLLGALYGGKPVYFLMEQWGWQPLLLSIAGVAFAIAALIWLLGSQASPPAKEQESYRLSSMLELLGKPALLGLALANLLMVGALEGFADVWGVTYLMKAYGLAKGDAAGAISCIFVGMLFGGPILAYLNTKISSYAVIALSGFGLALLFALMLLFPAAISGLALYALMFAVGILCCYQVIVFALGSEMVSPALTGITVAFLNSINMLGGSFFHSLIGSLLDLRWTGGMENGARTYCDQCYTFALTAIPLTALIGALIVASLNLRRR